MILSTEDSTLIYWHSFISNYGLITTDTDELKPVNFEQYTYNSYGYEAEFVNYSIEREDTVETHKTYSVFSEYTCNHLEDWTSCKAKSINSERAGEYIEITNREITYY